MVLTGVPRKLIRNALRVWQDIIETDDQHGVFIVHQEVKTVAVHPMMQSHLDQMIEDLPDCFVGLFDRRGDYQQFLSDVAVTANQLAEKRAYDG